MPLVFLTAEKQTTVFFLKSLSASHCTSLKCLVSANDGKIESLNISTLGSNTTVIGDSMINLKKPIEKYK